MAHRFSAGVLSTVLGLTVVSSPAWLACSSSDSDSPKADSGTSCATEATFFACTLCCQPTKSFTDGQNAIDDCICNEACKTECATTACSANPTDPSPDCKACADADKTGQTCSPKGQAICNADPACVAYQQCTEAAKCDDKPDEVDGGI